MPLLLLIPLGITSAALAFKTVSDEVQETSERTLPAATNNLVVLGAAGLGLYIAFRTLNGKGIKL